MQMINGAADAKLQRFDVKQVKHKRPIISSTLSMFQRILLATDGTVTDILESYLCEPIQVVKLSEILLPTPDDIDTLHVFQGTEMIYRKILLQGKVSHKNYLYAKSILVPDRLEDSFRHELLNSQVPIGRLWREKRIETFKVIIDTTLESANQLSEFFEISKDSEMLSRTYQVFSSGQIIMVITEKFPATYFTD